MRAEEDGEGERRSFGGGVGGCFGDSDKSWDADDGLGGLDVFLPTTTRFVVPRPAVMVVVVLMGCEYPLSTAIASSASDMWRACAVDVANGRSVAAVPRRGRSISDREPDSSPRLRPVSQSVGDVGGVQPWRSSAIPSNKPSTSFSQPAAPIPPTDRLRLLPPPGLSRPDPFLAGLRGLRGLRVPTGGRSGAGSVRRRS